ncbi:hypothetical protein EZS27_022671 [termite gut metagenome]|uniref:Uncharacterized protein n=1 Tax=termite gut metagenome TaxID=433724 RepID=A0A5J4R3Y8_9ZZZZ
MIADKLAKTIFAKIILFAGGFPTIYSTKTRFILKEQLNRTLIMQGFKL